MPTSPWQGTSFHDERLGPRDSRERAWLYAKMGWREVKIFVLATAAALALAPLYAPAARAATMVYVGNATSNDVDVMRMDDKTGELTQVQKIALPNKPGGSTPMTVTPDKKFLLVGVRSEPYTVATFAIDPASGKLTHVGDGPLADSMAYIKTDRTGRFLLGASYPGHKVSVNSIGSNGVVGPVKQTIGDIPNAHSIQIDQNNRFVIVPSLGSDTVRLFVFDPATGTLTPNSPDRITLAAKDGPRHFAFDQAEKHVYLITETSAKLYVFDYEKQTGQLTQKQQTDFTVKDYVPGNASWLAADIHITPNGKFLYASVRSTSTISAFKIDPDTGMVSPIGRYPTETFPRGFNIDPSGRFLVAAGQLSGHIMSYAIDQQTGELTILKRYPVGDNPNWVEFVDLP
jgi:6-phosphogluconolactonase